jgi:hypothetical protein
MREFSLPQANQAATASLKLAIPLAGFLLEIASSAQSQSPPRSLNSRRINGNAPLPIPMIFW